MVFCNKLHLKISDLNFKVTILILIDGFLQSGISLIKILKKVSHNPYFNRWFSAIIKFIRFNEAGDLSQSLF